MRLHKWAWCTDQKWNLTENSVQLVISFACHILPWSVKGRRYESHNIYGSLCVAILPLTQWLGDVDDFVLFCYFTILPSVLWHCWLVVRKSTCPVKNLSDEVLVRLICVWSSWCHCHRIVCCFIKIQISLTSLVPAYLEKWRLNEFLSIILCNAELSNCRYYPRHFAWHFLATDLIWLKRLMCRQAAFCHDSWTRNLSLKNSMNVSRLLRNVVCLSLRFCNISSCILIKKNFTSSFSAVCNFLNGWS